MINLRAEVCKELLQRTHPFVQLTTDKTISANLLDPCPITVSVLVQHRLQVLFKTNLFESTGTSAHQTKNNEHL